MAEPDRPAIPDAAAPPYLAGLNAAQRRAVEAVEGPVLVLAGAGTGKTRVLTTRLAHILATRRAWPSQILAVTFTNKAALEMKERLRAMIGQFERWKDRGYTFHQVPAGDQGREIANGKGLPLYQLYQERLTALNAADFGDLLLQVLTIFRTRTDLLQDYQQRFRYLLVDEYQDTNVAQYLWLRLLAQTHRNLCCVGDDDQSIYSWRGAEIGNILRFERDFPGAQIIRLEQNYRSTPHILAAASGLISKNEGRLGKTLWTALDAGERIILRGVWDGEEEARWVGDEIEQRQRKGGALADIAILVRAGFQTREFEERFITLGLPYRVIGGPRFYERREIRDALAYLRLVHQPADDLAFERIVNKPRRGIGDTTLRQIHETARAAGLTLIEAARQLSSTDEMKPAARRAVGALVGDLDRWRAMSAGLPHTELAETLLDESGYTAMLQADKSPDAPGRLENLKELIVGMGEFEAL